MNLARGNEMKGTIVIQRELCKGCGYCVMTCPFGLISLDTDMNRTGFLPAKFDDPGRCTGCALCAEMCPEIAIEVWRED
ncbi:MAG: 4Fe-4S binding protein [Chloroflexota bacterium]